MRTNEVFNGMVETAKGERQLVVTRHLDDDGQMLYDLRLDDGYVDYKLISAETVIKQLSNMVVNYARAAIS